MNVCDYSNEIKVEVVGLEPTCRLKSGFTDRRASQLLNTSSMFAGPCLLDIAHSGANKLRYTRYLARFPSRCILVLLISWVSGDIRFRLHTKKSAFFLSNSRFYQSRFTLVESEGVEPSIPECKSGVIPFNYDPVFIGSPGRIRTYNLMINSHSHYHCATGE